MEAEDVDGAAQRAQSTTREDGAAVGFERAGDGREIGAQAGGVGVRRRVDQRLAQGDYMVEIARRLGQARVDAGDGAPIGLVATRGRGVGRALGELGERVADRHQARVQRQLAAQLMQFLR